MFQDIRPGAGLKPVISLKETLGGGATVERLHARGGGTPFMALFFRWLGVTRASDPRVPCSYRLSCCLRFSRYNPFATGNPFWGQHYLDLVQGGDWGL